MENFTELYAPYHTDPAPASTPAPASSPAPASPAPQSSAPAIQQQSVQPTVNTAGQETVNMPGIPNTGAPPAYIAFIGLGLISLILIAGLIRMIYLNITKS